ncbi:MAG: response regulator transcription factor [Candidatus Obscuribacterales bacterium]|nr:response regulator transcription factor [Candidatus Obscuribacterales bacterium]
MAKILIIDDDRDLCEALEEVLSLDNHVVDLCHCGKDAMQIMDFCRYDLMLVDWELGDIEGPTLIQHFRKNGGVSPILMITGRGDIQSKVDCLDRGADDYMVKPFDMRELRARTKSLLRRPTELIEDEPEFMGIKIDPRQGIAVSNGKTLKLQPLEFRLLEFFVRNRGAWFSAEELISRVWSVNSSATPDSVRVSIKRLRTALEELGLDQHLESARNRGYRLE